MSVDHNQSGSTAGPTNSGSGNAASTESAGRLDPTQWVDAYGDYLYRYAMSRLRDSNAAEEVVQETFLAGIRYADQYAGRGAEQAWLLGILKRKIVDFVRRRTKHQKVTPYDDPDPASQLFDAMGNWKPGAFKWAAPPEAAIELSELQSVVQGCLENLPQGQIDVFVLSVMEELDSEQICEQLEITPSNFWVRMHRARLSLAKCVSSRWEA